MRTVRVAMLGAVALVMLSAGSVSCGGDGTTSMEVGTASVTNPPPRPVEPQRNELFNPTFVGWQFGGGLACDPNQFPVTVQIWDGVTDPCTEIPPEGARVVVIETSSVTAGNFLVAEACTQFPTARAFFGIVQGGTLFIQQASTGSMAILALDAEDVLDGTFSVRFPTGFGFTTGGFSAPAECLQLPVSVVPIGGTGGPTPPGTPGQPPPVGGGTNTGVGIGTGTGVGSGTGNRTGTGPGSGTGTGTRTGTGGF